MSRGYSERRAAWEAWLHIYTRGDTEAGAVKPVGFEHQCGTFNGFDDHDSDVGVIVCSGCGHKIPRPERECTPVYGPPTASKPAKIRVLRILEYVYPNAEIAAVDMAKWTHSIPTIQHRSDPRSQHYTMRSVTLPFDTIKWEDT